MGNLQAVYHPRLLDKVRMILCLLSSVKENTKLFRALLHFFIAIPARGPAFAQVYLWVGERGVRHYGRPPQEAQASEAKDRPALSAPSSSASPRGEPEWDKCQGGPKDQDPRANPSGPETRDGGEATRRQQPCDQQRAILERLKQGPLSDTLNEKGERVLFDHSQMIARQEQRTAEQCRF